MSAAVLKPEVGRRDFLNISAVSIAGVGLAAAAWPFVDQMNPSSAALSAGEPMSVDLSPVSPGQQIVVRWRSMPIFIVRRTTQILDDLKKSQSARQTARPDFR